MEKMTNLNFRVFLFVSLGCLVSVMCFKPVILMHGVFPNPNELPDIESKILKAHPGTNVTKIEMFSEFLTSIAPLWLQVDLITKQIRKVMKNSKDGVHLLCYSQGGITCRGILETMPDHNVDTFISLSSPQGGQYGDTDRLKYLFPNYLKENIYKFFYTEAGQEVSIGNYWNDPHHQDLYKKYSVFLAVLNNQTHNPQSHEYKKNFLRLKKMVLIGGPDDGVITPWQSSQFGFYDQNESVLPYKKTEWYLKDSFGLQTLEKRDAIQTYSISGVKHVMWHKNQTVFNCCIEKWLT
ncbi:lysosomal thioesterase PPT2-A-like isoform X2 [Lineus longissimus]|uniref:lysosomal thioesterase PPT2-A-like isoform X2 n=1 Tax=Lineus longissimus TaxID=88925 RepID=UPI002B4F35CD